MQRTTRTLLLLTNEEPPEKVLKRSMEANGYTNNTVQTQRMFPYSYFPETTCRNRKGARLSEKQPPQTRECILQSRAHMNWICDIVQGQGPKMGHHSLWFPEFDEVLTSFLGIYSWKPLWSIYQGYGHSLGDYEHRARLSSTKAAATQNQILKSGNSITKK